MNVPVISAMTGRANRYGKTYLPLYSLKNAVPQKQTSV